MSNEEAAEAADNALAHRYQTEERRADGAPDVRLDVPEEAGAGDVEEHVC